MTTIAKKATVTTLEAIATTKPQIFASETNTGKPCLAILTDKRLSTEDFKELMLNIQIAGGYGFVKFFAEHKTRLIAATKIDRETLESLVSSYVWLTPEKKAVTAKTPTKPITTKTVKKEQPTIDPNYAAFLKWQADLKAAK